MSIESRNGKAVWAARAATYGDELTDQITADAQRRMESWTARGRIPLHVRIMARLAGRPLPTPVREPERWRRP